MKEGLPEGSRSSRGTDLEIREDEVDGLSIEPLGVVRGAVNMTTVRGTWVHDKEPVRSTVSESGNGKV